VTNQPKKQAKPGRRQVQIKIPPTLTGTYANFAMLTHTASEVIIDFAQLMPNIPQAHVQARIVLTPTNAKLLLNALNENLANYEKKFGTIQTPPTLADHLFSNILKSGEAHDDDDDEKDDGEADTEDTPD
jgi:hypothetical protein